MRTGWIKFYRNTFDNPICTKDTEYFMVWCYILSEAVFEDNVRAIFKNEEILLKKGQLLLSVNDIVKDLKINRSKINRILKTFEIEKQITKETSTKNTLITVLNWDLYQSENSENEKRVRNERETSEKPSYYNKNDKNDNNIYICSPEAEHDTETSGKTEKQLAKEKKETENEAELTKNFEIIYAIYPKKKGRSKAYLKYKGWINGRWVAGKRIKLTNRQIYKAVQNYKREQAEDGNEDDLTYWKNFDTLMNNILDYVVEEE